MNLVQPPPSQNLSTAEFGVPARSRCQCSNPASFRFPRVELQEGAEPNRERQCQEGFVWLALHTPLSILSPRSYGCSQNQPYFVRRWVESSHWRAQRVQGEIMGSGAGAGSPAPRSSEPKLPHTAALLLRSGEKKKISLSALKFHAAILWCLPQKYCFFFLSTIWD